MTQKELDELAIFDYENIEDSFQNVDLFLGNGFSINLFDKLSYKSLFEQFLNGQEKDMKTLFKKFRTNNFEQIIQMLNNANTVNELLDIDGKESIEEVTTILRNGLIEAIKDNHPSNSNINFPQLRRIADELMAFGDIYTTNYDVYLYKAIIEILSDYKDQGIEPPYVDYFYEEISRTQLGFNYKKIYDAPKSIFYLHGALFLYFLEDKTNVYKLRKLDTATVEYINLVKREIENNNFPVFVAEGNDKDKLRTINNNKYLNFCYSNLRSSKNNLVVYGFSFGLSDNHIVEAINDSDIESLAISIYVGDRTYDELITETTRLRGLFSKKSVAIFNSKSLFKELRPYE